MKLIYVCSPCRGNPPYKKKKTSFNIWKAGNYCWDIIDAGHIPIAPHYFYSDFLKDKIPEQRAKALEIGLRLLLMCDEVWVFGEIISEGMKDEIARAEELGIPIKYMDR